MCPPMPRQGQSANPSAVAADCAASCAGSEAVLCVRATIITRTITITSPRSNTRVVDIGRLG